MDTLVLRLAPGADLRAALEAAAGETGGAAFVLAGIGSLSRLALRLAGAEAAQMEEGSFELLSLSGSLAGNGAHLHASVARADGSVIGGHVASGCTVRTTAELLLARLPEWELQRVFDAQTGYQELQARRR